MFNDVLKRLRVVPAVDFAAQIRAIEALEWRWKEMSTKKTSKEEATDLLALFHELYRNQKWFFGAFMASDDHGPHIDLHVDTAAMKEDGYTIPASPSGVKVCIMKTTARRKAVV